MRKKTVENAFPFDRCGIVAGAGKTETAKRFLQYLAFAATQGSGGDSSESNSRLEAQVVATSPLLEAFGNAQAGAGSHCELQFKKRYFNDRSSS